MDIRDPRGLKGHATRALEHASYPPSRLVLIHTGVSIGLTLLLTLANFFLNRQIAGTGGLSGLGIRSILGTAQSLLGLLIEIVVIFWEFGIFFAALRLSRRESTGPETLYEGFRRFGPLLRLQLLRVLILVGLGIVSYVIGFTIFSMTPFSNSLLELLAPLLTENVDALDPAALLEMIDPNALVRATIPAMVIIGVIMCVLAIPLLYRFRMAEYAILDGERVGAFVSLRQSRQLTRGNCLALFRLDLSFWWYYLLMLLIGLLAFGDVLLAALGMALPLSSDVASLLCTVVSLLLELMLYYRFRAYIETTYAAAYDALKEASPQRVPLPQKQNWTY